MLKKLKQDKLFMVVVLVILIAGVYFFAAYVPIKYTIRKDYTGMEYALDMSAISDSVSLHIYGYYYDYILETRFPAENHEQAAKVYEKLESAIVRKGLFDKEIKNTEKDIADRLPLSDGWKLEENENGVYVLSYHNSKVASITETREFAYGENSQMIVSNWIGMHASLTEETNILKNAQGDRIDKVLITIEPSAAEQMNGAVIVQELHYFYVASDNYFMDIVLDDNSYMFELEELLSGL